MNATLDQAAADPQQTIAELRRQLDECRAELGARNSAYGERIEHQAASNEVLKAMSASPGDPQPVFDLITRRAWELCNANGAALYGFDGELIHLLSAYGTAWTTEREAAYRRQFPMVPTRGSSFGRAILNRQIVHIRDFDADPEVAQFVRDLGVRSAVGVPLLRDGMVIGAIALNAKEPGGLSDGQVALLETFAEQAIIAIGSAETHRELQRRTGDLQESLEYQTATSDVLKVISRSTFDLQPVLDTLSETAARLCSAELAFMTRREGDAYRFVTAVGSTPETMADAIHLKATVLDQRSFVAGRASITGRVISEGRSVQIADLASDPEYTLTELITVGKIRTLLGVPLMREGSVIGTINLGRQRVEPFTDKQIELVRTFADQAVIALENARLLTETREALEQQTATAEVLQVINSSPGDLAPVFDAMLEKAMRLCGGQFGELRTYDGERFGLAAARGVPAAYAEYYASHTTGVYGPGTGPARILEGEKIVHVPDLVATEPYQRGDPDRRALVELGGARATLLVPLLKDRTVLGYVMIYRQEVQPFSDKQIAMLQNFAAQAVIAMENARLLTETREALEQQTATAEVLQVINSSPGDLAPVFDAMLEKAMRLCDAAFGYFMSYDGEEFETLALRGVPPPFAEFLTRASLRPSAQTGLGRIVGGARLVHVADLATEDAYRLGDPVRVATVDLGGARTWLAAALMKHDVLLGVFMVYRQEVRPFSDKQIALIQNFADQAVIAMENARLLTETREALEQQTATAEVLQVINSSPGDLAPVFDAMLEKAMRLCDAAFGLMRVADGEQFGTVATLGVPTAYAEFLIRNPLPADQGGIAARNRDGEPFVHTIDLKDDDRYRRGVPTRRAMVDLGGARTSLSMALTRGRDVLGAIHIYRQEVRAFSDKQIALLQNFAAQAVIAMENARLLTETREALEQQTATAEVLQVINSSPGDLAPVFDAILEKAHRLCGASRGALFRFDDETFHAVAAHGYPEDFAERLRQGISGPIFAPLIKGARLIHYPDLTQIDDSLARSVAERGGVRTNLLLPLRKDGALLGMISCNRGEVKPFTDKEITLLENFAAQAVIAMENARLLGELRERTRDLEESLEYQTATSDVLKVISGSTFDLQPVLDTLVETAARLCDAEMAFIHRRQGEDYRLAANFGFPPEYETFVRSLRLSPGRETVAQRALLEGEAVHVADIAADPEYALKETLELGKARTLLGIPLLREEVTLGVIALARQRVEPFTERQIELVQTFADQAVIAMENARLITETREALEQQTATAEVLQVINASPGDLAPVFEAMLEKAARLCEAALGVLSTISDDGFATHRSFSGPPEVAEFFKGRAPARPGPGTTMDRLIRGETCVHVPDATAEDVFQRGDPSRRAMVELAGARTIIGIALRKDNALLGAITLYRQEVRPFSEKEIALLQNFAAQAVIAIENARLLGELRDRTSDLQESLEYQTATSDVLQVISRSTFDLQPVLDTLCETAARLCSADTAHIVNREGEIYRAAATFAYLPDFDEFVRSLSFSPDRGTVVGRVLLDAQVVHLEDAAADPEYTLPEAVRKSARTQLGVPLLREGEPVGVIVLVRLRVEPFTERQIELVRTFADQAVIAIENTRLITETREALEQQTATAEVLQVINSSPGDLAPVFDTMLDKAIRLCETAFGVLWTYDGELFWPAAVQAPAAFAEFLRQYPATVPAAGSGLYRHVCGEDLAQIADIAADDFNSADRPVRRAYVELGGGRTALSVALRKDAALLGAIQVYRQEVRPFTDKQIALLQNFAAQAVIAMENARLLTETREALERQTATAEILRVISGSPTDVQPTFEAIAAAATRICGAATGTVHPFDGSLVHIGAVYGYRLGDREAVASVFPIPPSRGSATGRAILTRAPVHILDPAADPDFAHASLAQFGTVLSVPMLRDGNPIGAITVTRREIELFNDKQVDLLKTFADQAVIAVENVRLFNELTERTGDLQESLEYQTATSDVLQVISRSTFNLQPVLDTLVETAARLCNASGAAIAVRQGDVYRYVATFSVNPEWVAMLRDMPFTPGRDTVTGRALLERRVAHVADIAADPEHAVPQIVSVGGIRTLLAVPLLREGEPIGVIGLSRSRVEPFTERQIELVRTFADQAVIAMENTRLIAETREALEQQTATAEILQVINRSPGDLAPVFEAILEKAHSLCAIAQGSLELYDGERFHAVAVRGFSDIFADMLQRGVPVSDNPATRPLIDGARLTHIADLAETDYYITQTAAELESVRTLLCVPLRRDEALLGMIASARQEVRPFSEKEIGLLESFAAQAVIAMDNARLLNEIRQRQAELRVTFDNMGDGVAMFDSGQRLAAWNLNFQRILDLPDELLAERPRVPDFVRYLATHGEYGAVDVEAEVRRLSEAAGTQWSAERTRPDGRVIEVRTNPVPGGGMVLIYADITERKRAEAEIRAARDAAEAASRTIEAAYQELKTAQARLIQAEKMASLGQLTAGIAHEIKNPLNFVNNFAGLSVELLDELKETAAPAIAGLAEDERADIDEIVAMLTGNLEKIAEHGRRADGIVKSMLEHSRGASGERRAVDLNGLVEEALNLAYHGARAQDQNFNITLERDFAPALAPIELVPQDMTRVLLNLFGNGFYAAAKRGKEGGDQTQTFRPTLKVATQDFGEAVEIRIRDNGTGIAPEIKDKLFQPFFTTKPTGEGTGLGLSISWDIVTQQHGGAIAVDSRAGEFTEFVIHLPRSRKATTARMTA